MSEHGVPISGTKLEDVQVLNMVEWVPNEGTPHGHMHLLLHEVIGSWLNPRINQGIHLLLWGHEVFLKTWGCLPYSSFKYKELDS
jgi:hypothetical protein